MAISRSFRLVLVLAFLLGASILHAQSPELVVQKGAKNVNTIAFSPDGRLIATSGQDPVDHPPITLWDAATGLELRVLENSADKTSLAFSPNGKFLIGGQQVWNVESGAETLLADDEYAVDFRPNDRLLVSIGRALALVDLNDKELKPEMLAASSDGALSPDGELLALSLSGPAIEIFDAKTGAKLTTLHGPDYQASTATFGADQLPDFHTDAFQFSPDGKMLARRGSGSRGETIVDLWHISTGTMMLTRKITCDNNVDPIDPATSLAFAPDGKSFAVRTTCRTLEIFPVSGAPQPPPIKCNGLFAYSHDSKYLAAGGSLKVGVYDAATGAEKFSVAGNGPVAFAPDGTFLVTGTDIDDALLTAVTFWNINGGDELRTLKRDTSGSGESYALSIDGRVLAIGQQGNNVRLRDTHTGEERLLKGKALDEQGFPETLAFSRDGKILASVAIASQEAATAGISLWDVESGKFLRTLPARNSAYSDNCDNEGSFADVDFSPKADTLVSRVDCSVEVWSIARGTRLRALRGRTNANTDVRFSPDGKLILAGAEGKSVKIWNAATGVALPDLAVGVEAPTSLKFHPNGALVTVANVNSLELWEFAARRLLRSFANVADHSFTPDGKTLAVLDFDGFVTRLDVSDPKNIHSTGSFPLKARSADFPHIAFSENGQFLLSPSFDGVTVSNAISGKELVNFVSLSDGDWLVTTPEGLFDGTPNAWRELMWRFDGNTFSHAPVEAFFSQFFRPALFNDIMNGSIPDPPCKDRTVDQGQPEKKCSELSMIDIRQPKVKIASIDGKQAVGTMQTDRRTVKVSVEVAEDNNPGRQNLAVPSGAYDLRLFRNGSLVHHWAGDNLMPLESGAPTGCRNIRTRDGEPRRAVCEAELQVVAGKNELTAYAFNMSDVKSADSPTVLVKGATSLKQDGNLYILAVGVNKYDPESPSHDLKFAVADIDEISDRLDKSQSPLKRYAKRQLIKLVDTDATRDNVLLALRRMTDDSLPLPTKLSENARTELTKVHRMQPEDTVVIYYSGHGTAIEGRFYMIPHGGFPKTRLDERLLEQQSISEDQLRRLLRNVQAGQILMVIDACNSGAIEGEEKRRGPMNSNGLAQLAYEKGMYILTASQSQQSALEASVINGRPINHGLLTFALLNALTDKTADRDNNGSVIEREWFDYAVTNVPKLQKASTVKGTPVEEAGQTQYFQTPRLFYPRLAGPNPFVVFRR